MLTNVLDIFSEILPSFGFLNFQYTNDANKDANSDDKNDRLSPVRYSDLCAVFTKSEIIDVFTVL